MNLTQQLIQTAQGRAMFVTALIATLLFKMRRGYLPQAMAAVDQLLAELNDPTLRPLLGVEFDRQRPRPFTPGWSTR